MKINTYLFALLFTLICLSAAPISIVLAEIEATDATDATIESVIDSAETVLEETASEIEELEVPEKSSTVEETHHSQHPKVYIVPLGGEMNLKVRYNHPMDFEGGNAIEQVQMDTTDKRFLGLKTFHPNTKEAYAEFMVNPKLANFDEVVLTAKSTKHGDIVSLTKLEFTPEEELPDDLNPKLRAKRRLERLAELRKAGKIPSPPKVDKVKSEIKTESKATEAKVEKKVEEAISKPAAETKVVVEAEEEATEVVSTQEVKEEPKKKKKKKRWGLF